MYASKRENRLGTCIRQTRSGLDAECIEYTDATRIVVQFEDGFKQNTSWRSFTRGTVSHPSSGTLKKGKAGHVGETNIHNKTGFIFNKREDPVLDC